MISHQMPRSSSFNINSLYSLITILLVFRANGHGMMCTPRQRGAYAEVGKCGSKLPFPANPVIDYCPHCLNQGGFCGTPDHMIGGSFMRYKTVPIVETYSEGQVVDFQAQLDTNHNGYFEFHLCDLDSCAASDIDQNCFESKHCYKLERVRHPDCESPAVDTTFDCGPVDDQQPTRWYVPCRRGGLHLVGGANGYMRYRLPKGVSCEHCVIQWFWQTAHSCNPPGMREYFDRMNMPFGTRCGGDAGSIGGISKNMGDCPNGGEKFWSCADVTITDKNGQEKITEDNDPSTDDNMNSDSNNSDDMDGNSKEDMIPNQPPNQERPPRSDPMNNNNESGQNTDMTEMNDRDKELYRIWKNFLQMYGLDFSKFLEGLVDYRTSMRTRQLSSRAILENVVIGGPHKKEMSSAEREEAFRRMWEMYVLGVAPDSPSYPYGLPPRHRPLKNERFKQGR